MPHVAAGLVRTLSFYGRLTDNPCASTGLYLACYNVLPCTELRAIPLLLPDRSMTPEKCAKRARDGGSTVFGLQAGYQCFLGGNLTGAMAAGKADTCSDKCEGDPALTCGGGWSNEVYVAKELLAGRMVLVRSSQQRNRPCFELVQKSQGFTSAALTVRTSHRLVTFPRTK